MQNIKFVVKVNRGARAPEYVQRVDPTPIHMTTNSQAGVGHGQTYGRRRYQIPAKLALHSRVGVGAGQSLAFCTENVRQRC